MVNGACDHGDMVWVKFWVIVALAANDIIGNRISWDIIGPIWHEGDMGTLGTLGHTPEMFWEIGKVYTFMSLMNGMSQNHKSSKILLKTYPHAHRPHLPAVSMGRFGWNFGGWMGRSRVPLPPGCALITLQGALLECKRCFFSAVCGPIRLILRWRVGVGHSYLALNERATQAMGQMAPACVCVSAQAVSPESSEWASNASNGQMAPVCVCEWFCACSVSRKRWMSE